MTQFIDHDFAANFGGFMDPFMNRLATLSTTPVNMVSDFSSFSSLPVTLNVQSIVKYQILDQYRCKSLTGPSVLTTTNMVIAPPTNLTVNKYIVGQPTQIKIMDDFTVSICSAGGAGSPTFTYSLTSIPSGLVPLITFTQEPNGKLKLQLYSIDASKAGTYDLIIKGALSTGEFNEIVVRYMLTTDCKAAGIKVYFSQAPSLPTSRVNIPNKRIVEGVRGYIEGDFFYFQVLPNTI